MTVVKLAPEPGRTQVVTPLPSFARGEGASSPGTEIVSEYQDLALPADKTITLAVIAGPSKGLSHAMEKPRAILGRAGADVELDDPGVSRAHCAVEVNGEVVGLRDLDSTNGTYVNDERVRAAVLEHLGEFRIGSSVILVTITSKKERASG